MSSQIIIYSLCLQALFYWVQSFAVKHSVTKSIVNFSPIMIQAFASATFMEDDLLNDHYLYKCSGIILQGSNLCSQTFSR